MNWICRFIELAHDWRHIIKRDGLKIGIKKIPKEIYHLPYRHIEYFVLSRSLEEPLPLIQPKLSFEIKPFEAKHIDFVKREFLPSEAILSAKRLELDHYGLIASYKNQIAGCAWSCTDTRLEKVSLMLLEGDVLCTDAFTAVSFRRKGVQTTLAIARMREFQKYGYKRALSYIEKTNSPSLSVWKKLGASIIYSMEFRRYGIWRKTTIMN